MTEDWSAPRSVDDVDIAFPANALDFMPSRQESEAGLAALPDKGAKWIAFQRRWFYSGLTSSTVVDLKDGIDGTRAIRHLSVIQGSFATKREHKEAAVAYLASLWFNDIIFDAEETADEQ